MVNGRHCKLLWLSRCTVDALHVNGVLMVEMGSRRRGDRRRNDPSRDPFLLNCLWQSLGATTCRGLRVANTARLDANAHLVVAGILKRPPHFSELTWFPYLNGFVGLTHFRSSLFDIREPRRSCRGAFKELAVRLDAFVTAAPSFDPPRGKLVFDKERP